MDEALPWMAAALHGTGWIPSADGHLSFSLIGRGVRPKCARYSATTLVVGNPLIRARRQVAVFQRRTSHDIPWLFRKLWRRARHHWLLTGATEPARYETDRQHPHDVLDQQGMLRGRILYIPYQAPLADDPSGKIGRLITGGERDRSRRGICHSLSHILRPQRQPEQPQVFEEVTEQVNAFHTLKLDAVAVQFALFRTGEVHLWFDHAEVRKVKPHDAEGELLQPLLRDDQYVGGEEMPPSHTLLRQAFYFIKDVAHYHVHHAGSSDQMVPLVIGDLDRDLDLAGLNAASEEASLTELKWQRETLWGLSRSIEELVRRGQRERLRNALGIIAYAESFQSVLAGLVRKRGRLNQFVKVSDFHRYDFKAFRESIRIMLDRSSWDLGLKAAMAGSIIAVAMSSILVTNAIARRPEGNNATIWAGWVADFLATYPYALPTLTVLAMTALYQWLISEQRLLEPFRKLERAWRRFAWSHASFMVGPISGRWRPRLAVLLTFLAYGVPMYIIGSVGYALFRYAHP